ncbi:maltokinase [Streptomyces pathocidini]|uniref:Maltokinase n=2 Tax=Streptomyces pathocidini TaxID=1650571 RepID=A0ABW7UM55_9ACTN
MSEGSTRANPTRAATPAALNGGAPEGFSGGGHPNSPASRGAYAKGRPLAADHGLLPSLVPLLGEWLPHQRWFAGKGRPITGFTLVSATELLPRGAGGAAPGLLHLLVRARQSGPAEPSAAEGDCYQLLLGIRSVLPQHLAHALIGRPTGGPLHGTTVYEALADPRLTGILLERLRVPGRLGALRFTRAPSTAIPSGLSPRPITAEQSNSSVVYGDTYILKVFRRIGWGVNPDLELPRALARAGCDRVPHPTAWYETTTGAALGTEGVSGEPMTLGILQPFLRGSADGWQLALNSLSVQADFTGSARALGRATAEVHTALAAALPTAVLSRPRIEKLAAGMAARLEAAADAVPALRPYREQLHAAFADFAELGRHGRTWAAQRIHGDLHLGQALRAVRDGRWALIDFEGEPARPIVERRRLQPVARDIAGMLRSFDYAARSARPAPDSSAQSGWTQEWARQNRAAYCDGYAEAAGVDPREEPELMRAYETDKAVYEVLYEARHRPDWLPVPMAAIQRLAGASRSPSDGPGQRTPKARLGQETPKARLSQEAPDAAEARDAAGAPGRGTASGQGETGAPDHATATGRSETAAEAPGHGTATGQGETGVPDHATATGRGGTAGPAGTSEAGRSPGAGSGRARQSDTGARPAPGAPPAPPA